VTFSTADTARADYTVRGKGRLVYRDSEGSGGPLRPNPRVRVQLMDQDIDFDEVMATGKTDADGRFDLTGTAYTARDFVRAAADSGPYRIYEYTPAANDPRPMLERPVRLKDVMFPLGEGQFVAYSAGSFPTGRVNPYALELLRQNRIPTERLRSKAWDEFARPGAPRMDFVFTVCDRAAGETCPVWPGQPVTAHWGIADPAAVEGTELEKRQAFFDAFRELSRRIRGFMSQARPVA
jgi:protein-tyrosine-phosphatase